MYVHNTDVLWTYYLNIVFSQPKARKYNVWLQSNRLCSQTRNVFTLQTE